jgi:hypothetical protein
MITRRFKRLAERLGLPLIDLHDVRHGYATAGRNAKIDWKALSVRLGYADVAFTMKQYVQADPEAGRQVAHTLAELAPREQRLRGRPGRDRLGARDLLAEAHRGCPSQAYPLAACADVCLPGRWCLNVRASACASHQRDCWR